MYLKSAVSTLTERRDYFDRNCRVGRTQGSGSLNAIRAHLAEFGIVGPVGRKGVEQLLNVVTNSEDKRICLRSKKRQQ